METEFLTWGNFITWIACSVGIYLSLNFRLYMIFHHPGRRLKAKAKAKHGRGSVTGKAGAAVEPKPSGWQGICRPGTCPTG